MTKLTPLAILLAVSLASPVSAQTLTDLQIFPPQINMATSRASQSVVVQATFSDGLTRDVTSQAKLTLVNPALAKLEANKLTPVADGVTELAVEWSGKSV